MNITKQRLTAVIPSLQYRLVNIVCIVLLTYITSACQTTTPVAAPVIDNTPSYSQYYLWLKTLDHEQVKIEELAQKALMNSSASKDITVAQGKLILIYSLPNAYIHKPYKAKQLLNELLLTSNTQSKENLAFTMLLRDQLNTQLRLLEKQVKSKNSFTKKSDEHHAIIEQLNQQFQQVNTQLIQVNKQLLLLKKIDKNINERG